MLGAPGIRPEHLLAHHGRVSGPDPHPGKSAELYGMDLSGGGLWRIERFPHVGGGDPVAPGPSDAASRGAGGHAGDSGASVPGPLHRLAGFIASRHAAGGIPELVSADVILLVDGFAQLRTDFEELEDSLVTLLQRGGSFGIHVVLAMTRWNELRMAHQPLIGTRLEFRLNDPADSLIGPQAVSHDPGGAARAAAHRGPSVAQVALPVLDDTDDEIRARRWRRSRRVPPRAGGTGSGTDSAAAHRHLPEELPDALDEPELLPFGLRQDTMEPALLELGVRDQHLMAFGDTKSGKTTLLRDDARACSSGTAQTSWSLAVMDIRGDIAGEVPGRTWAATRPTAARGLSSAIAAELQQTPNSSTRRPRSAGPRIVVVADDYDILASGGTEPLKPLLPYLPSGS